MAEKKLDDLPPVYSNLGYDAESEAGPSAPTIGSPRGAAGFQNEQTFPTAPATEFNLGPPSLGYSPPALVFEDVYDACVNYVKDHCCYGSRFINRMKLTEIVNKPVYHYKLESFGEKRESAPVTAPYRGGAYDGPENGPEPKAWDIPAQPPTLFRDGKVTKDIPHTTTVHICTRCDGLGKVTCDSCWGRGVRDCSSCSGSGRDREDGSCSSCGGSGRETCFSCSGSGKVTCGRCDGYGKVKKYKVLIVTWTNHPSNFVSNTDNMPGELVLETDGITLFEKTAPSLQPILNADDQSVNAASINLLGSHERCFPSEMIIRQRHVLRALPVTRVKYQWKEREGEFYVYGTKRNVYFEDYPQQCCCCTCC